MISEILNKLTNIITLIVYAQPNKNPWISYK